MFEKRKLECREKVGQNLRHTFFPVLKGEWTKLKPKTKKKKTQNDKLFIIIKTDCWMNVVNIIIKIWKIGI